MDNFFDKRDVENLHTSWKSKGKPTRRSQIKFSIKFWILIFISKNFKNVCDHIFLIIFLLSSFFYINFSAKTSQIKMSKIWIFERNDILKFKIFVNYSTVWLRRIEIFLENYRNYFKIYISFSNKIIVHPNEKLAIQWPIDL